jgi:hypothetical protein
VHQPNRSETRKAWETELRKEAIKHYGGKCSCCRERRFEFLTVVPYGNTARTTRTPIPYWLKQHNFPYGFRIYCWNCLKSIKLYGYCPHSRTVRYDRNLVVNRSRVREI